jgi:hypothetical protein
MIKPDGGNEWAQTGNLTHIAIDAFHKLGSVDTALFCLQSARAQYPIGNAQQAANYFDLYIARQAQWGEVVATERKVTCKIPPHETDPTQEEIIIKGTLDQVRLRHGTHWVCDIKTGAVPGKEMVNYFAPQLAAYQLGAAGLGYTPSLGAIIRLQDFRTGGDVFRECGWPYESVLQILDPVRIFVAQVRAGKTLRIGGKHCEWCQYQSIGNCTQGIKPQAERRELLTLGDLL